MPCVMLMPTGVAREDAPPLLGYNLTLSIEWYSGLVSQLLILTGKCGPAYLALRLNMLLTMLRTQAVLRLIIKFIKSLLALMHKN